MLDQLKDAVDRMEASIEASLPPHEALARRQKMEADQRRQSELRRTVRNEAARAIELLASGLQMNFPYSDIADALSHAHKAAAAARELEDA
jgi:hypothetical protein